MLIFVRFTANLSAGGSCVPDSVGHVGEDGDEPALTIKLLPEPSAHAAQQSSQQVVVTSTKLTVLQVVLQEPDAETQTWYHTRAQPAQAGKNQLTRRGSEQFECPSWLSGAGNEPKSCPSSTRTSEPERQKEESEEKLWVLAAAKASLSTGEQLVVQCLWTRSNQQLQWSTPLGQHEDSPGQAEAESPAALCGTWAPSTGRPSV